MASILEAVVRTYLKNIYHSLHSTAEGMAVTMSHMFRRPSTIQYPNKLEQPLEKQLSNRFRGILQMDSTHCVGCRSCEKICPIDCVAIDIEKNKETRRRFLIRFDIDISKCMHCGLCSENCPTFAIYHTKVFNGATRNIDNLLIRFVDQPVLLSKAPKDGDPKENHKDLSGAIVIKLMEE